MFEMFSVMTGLMKNAHLIPEKAKDLKERLQNLRVEAVSEYEVVRVVVTGELQIVSLSIASDAGHSASVVEELTKETTNRALADARERAAREVAALAESLGMPGLGPIMARLGVGPG